MAASFPFCKMLDRMFSDECEYEPAKDNNVLGTSQSSDADNDQNRDRSHIAFVE